MLDNEMISNFKYSIQFLIYKLVITFKIRVQFMQN